MFRSIRKLALPTIAAALLSFTTAPSSAQTPASRVAGKPIERITPEATVISTAHYDATIVLSCNGSTNCQGDFPIVGGRRLHRLA